jgi:diguanylate cyclase (GGDEF)-like protein
MLQRLRTDFQLAIITLFSIFTTLGISPFAVYRFLTGSPWVGVLDTGLVMSICAITLYAWRTGDTQRPGILLSITLTGGAIASSTMLGEMGLLWMYPALLSNFFLIKRNAAVVVTIVSLAILVLHGQAFGSGPEMASFLASSTMVSVLAFVLAIRTEAQRLQLEVLATRDPLTGVDNRRAMEQELKIAIETHKRSRASFGLVMLDLDHFKRINDEFGHDAGDRVLVAFTDLIGQSTRKMDRFFRYGGEEFILLLPGADIAGLRTITANLRRHLAGKLRSPDGRPVTVSLGAAVLMANESWQKWLGRADAALYQAKTNGRDQAVIDGSSVTDLG